MRIIKAKPINKIIREELAISTINDYKKDFLILITECNREAESKIFDDTTALKFEKEELIMWNRTYFENKLMRISKPLKYDPILDEPGTERN